MNENKILSQIQNECSELSPDNFDKIRRDISELSESYRADIIHTENINRFRFLKYTAAAAAFILPLLFTANMYSDRNSSEQNYETDNYAVSQTVSQSVVPQTVYQTSSVTETAVTAVTAAETGKNAVTETASEQVSTVTEVSYQPVFIQVTDTESTETENITEPAASDEIPAESEEYSEPVSDVTTVADSEIQPVTDVSFESFESELKLVPGYKDKIFRLKFNADKTDDQMKVFTGENRSYSVKSPDAYTVYVYDVIVYDYDYFDFLGKGEFLFKSENRYTLDEILLSEEKLLTVEDLVSAGLITDEQ